MTVVASRLVERNLRHQEEGFLLEDCHKRFSAKHGSEAETWIHKTPLVLQRRASESREGEGISWTRRTEYDMLRSEPRSQGFWSAA